MFFRIKVFLICLLSCFLISGYAADSSQLATFLNSVRTMRGDFIQTIYDNRGKPIQKSYGRMAMVRPGKFRWEVVKPIPQLIIANAPKLWIYDPDLQQVTLRSLKQMGGEVPALLLSTGDLTLEKDFTVKEQMRGSLRWFTLVSKKSDATFNTIQLGFIDKQMSEMRLQDHLGHTTHIQFRRVITNTAISPALFIFKIPAHVDVIDETRR